VNARERIVATLDHRLPEDHLPLVGTLRPELHEGVMQRLGVSSLPEMHKALGIEGWGYYGFTTRQAQQYAKLADWELPAHVPYGGRKVKRCGELEFEDALGTVRRIGADGKFVEWVTGPLAETEDPEAIKDAPLPRPEDIIVAPDAAEEVTRRKKDAWVGGSVGNPFRTAWFMRGIQKVLMDYHLNLPFLEALYDRIYEYNTAYLCRLAEVGVDQIGVGGDIAMQDRLMMGPQKWRDIDRPRHKYMLAQAKKVKPDLQVFIHTDGNYLEIIPDLIECGYNVLNPIQPECMDPAEVKKRFGSRRTPYGDKICLHGSLSVQRTLPFGSVEDVIREVETRIETCGYDGGLILGPSNVVPMETAVENIIALYETARNYDLPSLGEHVR